MMIRKKKLKKTKAHALAQIFILVVGIIAISWMIGGEFKEVSALENCGDKKCGSGENCGNCIEDCPCPIGSECDKTLATPQCVPELGKVEVTGTKKCTGGTYKCSGSVLMICSYKERVWTIFSDCATTDQLCSAGKCVDRDKFNFPSIANLPIEFGKQWMYGEGREILLGWVKGKTGEEAKDTEKKEDEKDTEEDEKKGFLSKVFGKETLSGQIIRNAGVASLIYFGIKNLGKLVNADANVQRAFNNAANMASTGYFIGSTLRDILIKYVSSEAIKNSVILSTLAMPGIGLITAGIGILISLATFKNERQQIITFDCNVWDAKTGGADCEQCNKQGILACSEYQCRSLGQGCQIINEGKKEQMCANVLCRSDAKYPVINTWKDALISTDYKYTPDNAISPPDKGVYVQYTKSTDKCIPAFTPLSFGITLNEPAKCKFSLKQKNSFAEMDAYLSNGLSLYNHSIVYSLPGTSALAAENLTLQNDGNYKVYIRCEDACGNSNTANFVFKYCIDKGPDTTAPLIVGTSLLNGGPISYNQETVDVSVYVNEPAECKWSKLDQEYDSMENKMVCNTKITEMNAQMLYTCKTTLTGLKNEVENKFYFRCKDQPSKAEADRNPNRESYDFSLLGTRPLIISEVKPDNETIKDSTDSVKVTLSAETSAGYNEGEATCSYSETGKSGDYNVFYETNSYTHSQDLWLVEGDYKYYIKCIDLGGNADIKNISFSVDVDNTAPSVVRAYHEDKYLKIITNEKAECVSSKGNVGCNYDFKDGSKINSQKDGTRHYIDWNPAITYYIKCKDEYGNQPARQDECSIIVRAFSISSG